MPPADSGILVEVPLLGWPLLLLLLLLLALKLTVVCARKSLNVPSTTLLEALASASRVACAALTPVAWETPLPSKAAADRGQAGVGTSVYQ